MLAKLLRDSDGKLQGDLGTFSRGIPKLIKDINALGLKVGLYSSNGTLTCEDLPASLGNERLDAKTIASWGCEFLNTIFAIITESAVTALQLSIL